MNQDYNNFMREYQERKKYDRETFTIEQEDNWDSLLVGFKIAGLAFTIGFIVYWIVRLGT